MFLHLWTDCVLNQLLFYRQIYARKTSFTGTPNYFETGGGPFLCFHLLHLGKVNHEAQENDSSISAPFYIKSIFYYPMKNFGIEFFQHFPYEKSESIRKSQL